MDNNQILFEYRSNTSDPIEGLPVIISVSFAAFSEGTLNFTSDVIGDVKYTTDDNGQILVDLSKLFDVNRKLISLFKEKYDKNFTIGLRLTLNSLVLDPYASYVTTVNLDKLDWIHANTFLGYDYSSKSDPFTPQYIADKPTDLKTLISKYKEQELKFLETKAQYEADIKGNLDITIERGRPYEPDTFRKVITRISEFQKGTLNPAIEYTKQAGLITEQQRLTTINNIMDILTKMYPNVRIGDGEGLPYNNDKGEGLPYNNDKEI
jgi:hypothetical protein